ncbi:MAG TPA: GldG family protein, partial [Candidatus Competibacteraceae bacterium]|nr:GldG family protein [Candidatus Competibacteraceae bacterium]
LHLRHLLFLLLFATLIGLLAWLSNRYVWQLDWTYSGRNTLAPASQIMLSRLAGPLHMTVFTRPDTPRRSAIQILISRYQRYKPDIALDFVNPDAAPGQTRALDIQQDGELLLEYQGRRERLTQLNEQNLTNALQRLSRQGERMVLFLEGHGERKPHGQANHDLGNFGREAEATGLHLQELNLARQTYIPRETVALVIASPQVALLPGEVQLILEYAAQGGNLLWLLEPNEDRGLQGLAAVLGVKPLPGVIVDPNSPVLGITDPTVIVVVDYGPHPVTAGLRTLTLFPGATALEIDKGDGWQSAELLLTQGRSWIETGRPESTPRFDPDQGEQTGPYLIGFALSRPRAGPSGDNSTQQRIIVIGDGDFLSNAYLGNGGNLALGLNLLNWLAQDDPLIAIPPKTVPDPSLNLSRTALAGIGIVFLLILPLSLLTTGWLLWWRRQRR